MGAVMRNDSVCYTRVVVDDERELPLVQPQEIMRRIDAALPALSPAQRLRVGAALFEYAVAKLSVIPAPLRPT